MNKIIKCKLKSCACNDTKGRCEEFIPNIVLLLKVDSISCPFFDCDNEKSIKEFKDHGGMAAAIARMNGKRTEKELKEIKSDKRKPREDKGKKRGRKPKKNKEESNLSEIM